MTDSRRVYRAGWEGLLDFISFGLDRAFPDWVPFLQHGTILHVGPGDRKKISTPNEAMDPAALPNVLELDWPEYDADRDPIPLPDHSCAGIVATHVLEHLHDPRHFLREAERVLANGAALSILVPHAQSLLFLQDLDHKTPFTVDTWKTFLNNAFYPKSGGRGLHMSVGVNVLFGLKEENLCLITQLIKHVPMTDRLA